MRTYTIARKTEPFSWDTVAELPIDLVQLNSGAPITAKAQICYDDEAIYIRQSAVEEHIRAEESDPLGAPCEDSCMEFFFSPIWGDSRYFNIEFNPNGCIYLGIGDKVDGKVNLHRLIPEKMPITPAICRTNDGWVLEYSVPYTFIRHFFPEFKPKSGYQMRANCYKCGDKTVTPHYFAWNPLDPGVETFHSPECFGTMIFA